MPPDRFITSATPRRSSTDAAIDERAPDWHCTTIGRSRGNVAARPARYPSGTCTAPPMWPDAHSFSLRTSTTVTSFSRSRNSRTPIWRTVAVPVALDASK